VVEAEIIAAHKLTGLQSEANQLVAIFNASRATAKRN